MTLVRVFYMYIQCIQSQVAINLPLSFSFNVKSSVTVSSFILSLIMQLVFYFVGKSCKSIYRGQYCPCNN